MRVVITAAQREMRIWPNAAATATATGCAGSARTLKGFLLHNPFFREVWWGGGGVNEMEKQKVNQTPLAAGSASPAEFSK